MSFGDELNAGRVPLRTPRFRARTLAAWALVLAVGCGSEKVDSTDETELVCEPGEVRPCVGYDDCDDTQECLPDGSGFTECDCDAPPDGGDVGNIGTAGAAGGSVGVPTGGASQGGPSSGGSSSGGAPSGVGGTNPAGGGTGGANQGGYSGWGVTPSRGGSAGSGDEPPPGGSGVGVGGASQGGYSGFPDDGGVAGENVVAGAPGCTYDIEVSAEFENEVATLSYSADHVWNYDGYPRGTDDERVDVSIEHKQDIDVADGGGCISAVSVQLRQYGGCQLSLYFAVGDDPSALVLTSAQLEADSLCPNWGDADEGTYWLDLSRGGATLDLSGAAAWEGHLSDSCLSVPLEPSGVISLVRPYGRQTITLDLASLSITGQMRTTGSPSACCPGVDCIHIPGGAAGGTSVGRAGGAGMTGAAGAIGHGGALPIAGAPSYSGGGLGY